MGSWNLPDGPPGEGGPFYIGILNATPDSFSDGGRFASPEAALAQARRLVAAGARMLDLGAESTRPGASPVPAAEEWARLEPVLQALRSQLPQIPLSLDTRHAPVAAKGLEQGVSVLNDITGFSDPAMLDLAAESRCGLLAMRSRLQDGALSMPDYGGPGEADGRRAVRELREILCRLETWRVDPGRLVLDPGFGFGTTYREDLALWNRLPALAADLGWDAGRICIGISRKRFLAWRNGTPGLPPAERDALTAAAHAEAQAFGYRVFRTHAIP